MVVFPYIVGGLLNMIAIFGPINKQKGDGAMTSFVFI